MKKEKIYNDAHFVSIPNNTVNDYSNKIQRCNSEKAPNEKVISALVAIIERIKNSESADHKK